MKFFIQRLISKWNTQYKNIRVNLTPEKIILAIAFITIAESASAQSSSFPEWSITGGNSVNEGACVDYTLAMSGTTDSATIDIELSNISTNSADYGSLNTAITAAVNTYSGPGSVSWNGTTLSFSGNDETMSNLTFSLCAAADSTTEGSESYSIELSDPIMQACVMPELFIRARINGGHSTTSNHHILNVVTDFGSNGTSTTFTDQGTAVYSYVGGVLTNTTGQLSQFTDSDNTLPAFEDGYVEFELPTPLNSPLNQLDVRLLHTIYPSSDVALFDFNI